jgi:hypothetical protein
MSGPGLPLGRLGCRVRDILLGFKELVAGRLFTAVSVDFDR